jgi:pyruvate kinase
MKTPRSTRSRKTKIVATIGPASASEERLRELILAGANVFRLNFSHGTHQSHLDVLQRIRKASDQLGKPVAVLQDLCGPKIRISTMEGDYVTIVPGAKVTLKAAHGEKSTAQEIFVEGLDPAKFVKPSQQVLLSDGMIELRSLETNGNSVLCEVVRGGRVRARVGIAFPESAISLPATTEKDLVDLAWGVQHGVDYVAVSFVQNATDIVRLKEHARQLGGNIHVVAKIERRVALENIGEIMGVCDGVMVARGDLGLELPIEQLPRVQRQLIELANYRGIPVIVATQMLTSMVTAARPTRAEVSDVATAVMNGADAVMLSEETTIGENPVACVDYLHRIAREAEQTFEFEEYKLRLRDSDSATVPDAIAYAACAAAIKVDAAAVIACTETGISARLLSKYRPQQALYGISGRPETVRRLCLVWGITPLLAPHADSRAEEMNSALAIVQKLEKLPNGAKAVVTGGVIVRTPGSTSVLEVREMCYQ